jgi:hypothetical protein
MEKNFFSFRSRSPTAWVALTVDIIDGARSSEARAVIAVEAPRLIALDPCRWRIAATFEPHIATRFRGSSLAFKARCSPVQAFAYR